MVPGWRSVVGEILEEETECSDRKLALGIFLEEEWIGQNTRIIGFFVGGGK